MLKSVVIQQVEEETVLLSYLLHLAKKIDEGKAELINKIIDNLPPDERAEAKKTIESLVLDLNDDEVKTIIESFCDQLKAAGIDRFEKYVKDVYEEDPDSVSFYD